MSSCMHYQQQISQLLDGELPAEQAQTLRAHLRTCPDCRRAYDDFLAIQAAVRDAAAEPPADLTARIMQQVHREPVPMAPRAPAPTRPVRCTQPRPIRKTPPARPAARKRPASDRTSPLLPISVMAACLALILGATLWFAPHRNPSSGSGTALDSSRTPTVTVSPSAAFSSPSRRRTAQTARRCTSPTARPSRNCQRFWCARTRHSRSTPRRRRCACWKRPMPTGRPRA